MFQDLIHLFQKLGLKETDAKVFLTCLHFKDGLFVHEIVKETGINRSTVDLILERLIDAGFMNKLKVGARYKCFSENPETLLYKQEQLLMDFKTVVPLLSKLGSSLTETEIKFYEGAEGIRQIFHDMYFKVKMAEGEKRQVLNISYGAAVMKTVPDLYNVFINKRIKEGIPIKIIAPQNTDHVKAYQDDPGEIREVKYFDNERFPFSADFHVYGDTVTMSSLHKPIGGVVLTNPKIAESMRSVFNLMWLML